MRYITETDIDYPYPDQENLVRYQTTQGSLLLTVFPIQHNPKVEATAIVANVGSSDEKLASMLYIKNKIGHVLDEQVSGNFLVRSGGNYRLLLVWEGSLPDGAYKAEISIENVEDIRCLIAGVDGDDDVDGVDLAAEK